MTIIGAFAPRVESSPWLTLQLAADEFNAVDDNEFVTRTQPVLVVLCDDAVTSMGDALRHLDNQLGVRGIIASLEDRSLRAAASLTGTTKPMFFLSPNGSLSPPPSSEVALGGLWYLGPEYRDAAPAYLPVVERLVVTRQRRDPVRRPPRLASVIGEAPEDLNLADAVAAGLEVDSMGIAELARVGRWSEFRLSNASALERDMVLARLVEYSPDIVLVFAGRPYLEPAVEQRASFIAVLEDNATTPEALPLYVFGPRGVDDDALRQLTSGDSTIRSRAVGVSNFPPPDPDVTGALQTRFRSAFPATNPEFDVSFRTYDALYYLGYAIAAASESEQPLTADAIAKGLGRITQSEGTRVDVGPGSAGLEAGIRLLHDGMSIRLHSTTGSAPFALDQPVRASGPHQVYCWGPDGRLEMAALDEEAGGVGFAGIECLEEVFGVPTQ